MPAASCQAKYSRRLYRLGCEQTALSKQKDDLQGRKITEITKPGFYIVDGEKVFVK